jgi:hypothetical protein
LYPDQRNGWSKQEMVCWKLWRLFTLSKQSQR